MAIVLGEIPNPYTPQEGVHEHANIGGAFVYVIPPLLRILQRMFVLFRQNPGFLYFSDLYNQVLGELKSEHTTKHINWKKQKKLEVNIYMFCLILPSKTYKKPASWLTTRPWQRRITFERCLFFPPREGWTLWSRAAVITLNKDGFVEGQFYTGLLIWVPTILSVEPLKPSHGNAPRLDDKKCWVEMLSFQVSPYHPLYPVIRNVCGFAIIRTGTEKMSAVPPLIKSRRSNKSSNISLSMYKVFSDCWIPPDLASSFPPLDALPRCKATTWILFARTLHVKAGVVVGGSLVCFTILHLWYDMWACTALHSRVIPRSHAIRDG